MNSEQERPFVCSAPGCSQVSVSTHVLQIYLQMYYQTPTPTRFLKNCEEVGLFSELDCSIEQEFRKAQEEEDNKQ
uniref:Uncharacterized protein n=1 Tax=Hucho hucho TaxID=62062 RepID=A0A4W5LSF3_9TELE